MHMQLLLEQDGHSTNTFTVQAAPSDQPFHHGSRTWLAITGSEKTADKTGNDIQNFLAVDSRAQLIPLEHKSLQIAAVRSVQIGLSHVVYTARQEPLYGDWM